MLLEKIFFNRKTISILVFSFLFGTLVYSTLITNNLTNQYDGLWTDTYFFCGDWELSNGRWLWRYIDILKQGYNANPLNSYLALMIFSISNVVLVESIGLKKDFSKYFSCFGILTTTTICCFLSYRYLAEKYAISYFLSILSAYVLIKYKNKFGSIIISSMLYMLSLASYQSEVSCFCIAILMYLLNSYFDKNFNFKEQMYLVVKTLLVIIIGSIMYKISWDILLNIYSVSASSYKGGNSLSVINMISNFPKNIIKTYYYFYNYFFGDFKVCIYQNKIYFIVYIISLIIFFKSFTTKSHKIIPILLLLLLPIACNFSVLYVDSGIMIQQTIGTSIITFLVISIAFEINDYKSKSIIIIEKALVFFSAILFFGCIVTTEIDIEAIRQGNESSKNIVYSIYNTLINDGLFDENKKYCFVGKPSNSLAFNVNDIWNMSNEYAQFGNFWDDSFCMMWSYNGIVKNLNISLTCCYSSTDYYDKISKVEEVREMPVYPNEGYIKEIDGITVIKVSNNNDDDVLNN